jgi:hypothetical protein
MEINDKINKYLDEGMYDKQIDNWVKGVFKEVPKRIKEIQNLYYKDKTKEALMDLEMVIQTLNKLKRYFI